MIKNVISVEHLTKQYDLGVIGTGTLTRDINRWWARVRGKPDPYTTIGYEHRSRRRGETILALDDVSFTVQQGQALGIIGANGAGKSTLLKLLSRVTAPTSGVIKMKGRIGSLLEVGTGFHGELTGRENVYLNGAILGMRKEEVDKKFDEIVAFSGVEKFIDTPVKRYSSGMYVRLGFAVAAHLDPEILIVDEVLAVGDAEFQRKCLGKMNDVAEEGRTVLFVSHNMPTIQRLCPLCIWMNDGKIKEYSQTEVVVGKYLSSGLASGSGVTEFDDADDQIIIFTKVELLNQDKETTSIFNSDEPIKFRVHYSVKKDLAGANIVVMIMDNFGDHLWEVSDLDIKPELYNLRSAGNYICDFTAPPNVLRPGKYRLQLGSGFAQKKIHRPEKQIPIEIKANGYWKKSYKFFGLSRSPIVVPWQIEGPYRKDNF